MLRWAAKCPCAWGLASAVAENPKLPNWKHFISFQVLTRFVHPWTGTNPRAVARTRRWCRENFSPRHNFRENVRVGFIGWIRIQNFGRIDLKIFVAIFDAFEQFFWCRISRSENLLCQRIVRSWFGKDEIQILSLQLQLIRMNTLNIRSLTGNPAADGTGYVFISKILKKRNFIILRLKTCVKLDSLGIISP